MTRYFYFLLLTLSCLFYFGCTALPTELKTAEQLMETHPDSSLRILQKMNGSTLHGRYNKALYALLLSQAQDKNDIKSENDSLISIATGYFDNSDPVHAGYAWFYHARTAANRDSVNEQATNLLKANEFAQQSLDNKLLGLVNYDMATMHFNQRRYSQTIQYSKIANNYFSRINDSNNVVLSNLYTGYSYLYLSKIDSAKIYYKRAVNTATRIKNKILLSIVLRNIGTVYFQQENYPEAVKCFYRVPLTGNKIYDSNKYYLIAGIHIKTNNLDSAKYYLHKVKDLHEIETDYYRLWQAISEKENDKTKALYYANQVSVVTDSVYRHKLRTSFEGLEKKYKYQSLQIVNQKLTIKNKQKGLYVLFLLLTLSIFIVVFLFWRLRVKKNEVEYQKDIADKTYHLLEKEKENTTLLERQLKLQDILLSNIKMHQTNSMKRPSVWKEGSNDTIYKQFETFYNELKTYVDLEFANFTVRLKDKHPSLTENDIFISCLLISEFDTGMIATILNVQIESINKQRYRLRTKLKLENSENLLDYLIHF